MISEAPPFWWEPADWRPWGLWPVSAVYGLVAGWRMDHASPVAVAAPILCVGNFTVGGAGKTPACIRLARAAAALGRKPGFVSRGHGGVLEKPRLVDTGHDIASAVGDEPLLLADVAPAAVGADRVACARVLTEAGCDFIIMDDGFQSRRLHWDFSLVVIDSHHGLGNGHVIPGGPLRAPIEVQMRHADALLVVGNEDNAARAVRLAARAARPIYHARIEALAARRFKGRRFLAYAGIGHPDKFYATLAAVGAEVVATRSFADHYVPADDECADLMERATALDAIPVTTAKDMARLVHAGAGARALAEASEVLQIELRFDPDGMAEAIVRETIGRFRDRAY